ncbi:glycosyltransferase family 4 protein [Marinomonas flavescens]|uniref:glycosyltransferase family 4 protein n=1 Tax=Marinomonas flavescens TaxID=2529379 RepID=UPI001A9CE7A4|nr:glycosyltransferase family 4 protein [Marinomonas flavescens]
MKIAFISQNVAPILGFRRDLIIHLVSKGHTVYAFALDYTSDSVEALKALGAIPIAYSLNKSGMNPIIDLKDTWLLSRKLKKIAPDVVFSFFVKPSIYGTLAAKLAGVPRRIAMLEGLGYMHTPGKTGFSIKKRLLQVIHGLLCSFSYQFADEVLFLNNDDPKDLAKFAWLNKYKLKVIGPIGLNLKNYPFCPVNSTAPVRFILIARLLAEKGIFEYLEAARIVKNQYPHVEFVVLGGLDPDNPAALTSSQLDEVINDGIIIYPGHVKNVSEWIAGSHVFVLPSYREGYPRSTQEAMSIGRAVITTDVPGCRETVINGVNGFIVPAFDAQALVKKMKFLSENPFEVQRMGEESARIASEKFDVHKINLLFENIFLGK